MEDFVIDLLNEWKRRAGDSGRRRDIVMERKAKIGFDALLVVGIIFSILGPFLIVIGISAFLAVRSEEDIIFLSVYGGTGLIFLVIGLAFLTIKIKQRQRCNRLLESGSYIMAEIAGTGINYNVRINGKSPYVVECQYRDMLGNVHIFKSRCLYFNPEPLFQDRLVKVYVEGDDYKHYYVDIDGVLPQVIRH